MLKKRRPDGTLLKDLPHFTRLVPYLMGTRIESTIFFEQDFDITHALDYVHSKVNDPADDRLTFFHVFLCAGVRTLALRPKLNRFVSGYHFYQRNQIRFNFVAKKTLTDEGREINVTIPFSAEETLSTLPSKVNGFISRGMGEEGTTSDDTNALLVRLPRLMIRLIVRALRCLDYYNMLPGSFIDSMPFWVSIFFTNVGSVGLDAPLHHNFNIGTCGLFIALGKIRRKIVTAADGSVTERAHVKVTFSYDDRIADGIYCGRAIDLFRDFVEHPEKLEEPPRLSPAQRAELMLKQ